MATVLDDDDQPRRAGRFPKTGLTEDEIDIIDRMTMARRSPRQADRYLAHYLTQIAKLGGTSPAPMIRHPPASLCGEDGRASSISKSVPA